MADRYFRNPFTLPLEVDQADAKLTLRSSVLMGLSVRFRQFHTRLRFNALPPCHGCRSAL